MFEKMEIQSKSGPYIVSFAPELLSDVSPLFDGTPFFLLDANIARLYPVSLSSIISHENTIVIEANEKNKAIDRVIPVIEQLVEKKIRRGNVLIAIGGGIVQDICCFISSTLLRGVEWRFVPTTLLAQADSCIGSKSSINLSVYKNILGTFNPPSRIWICPDFLETLETKEMRSGIGEILKVHAIAGQEAFDSLKVDFCRLISDRQILLNYIRSALLIKREFIEIDEYDQDVRIIFNYGHSFGHAIETATKYRIPHGVAVSIGMDMANHIAVKRDLISEKHKLRMHDVLRDNYKDYLDFEIPIDDMLSALMRDKKNTATELRLILPVGEKAEIKQVSLKPDDEFKEQCKQFIEEMQA